MAKADPVELAWAAGFFDGEGHTGFRDRPASRPGGPKTYKLVLSVGQRYLEPLERFQRAVGGGRIYTVNKLDRPYYNWRMASVPQVIATVELLRPYLCSIKVKQANEAITKYHEGRNSG